MVHLVNAPDLSEYLTTVQVAQALGKDRSTITRWVREGAVRPDLVVPGHRGRWLWSPATVERLGSLASEPP